MRFEFADKRHRVRRRARLAANNELVFRIDQAHEAFAQNRVIVHQQNPFLVWLGLFRGHVTRFNDWVI